MITMKNLLKRILLLLVILPGIYSCEDEILNRKPLDKISDSDVWVSESLLTGYVLDLYTRLPDKAWVREYNYTDEGTTSSPNNNSGTNGTMDKDNTVSDLEYWDYGFIRDCNIFLEKIGATPIPEAVKMQLEGEVRAMRAYAYFEMVKRYGGVPLVATVIDPYGEIDPEVQKRSNEVVVHDFIDAEYSLAIQLLENVDDVKPVGRINKWTALALKARANLWAASIAKFGSVQVEGLVGVPAGRADEFYQKALDAASEVLDEGPYSLFEEYTDKAKNYQYIFLEKGNSEVMFAREYNGIEVRHNWDYWMAPNNYCSGQGSRCNPGLNLVLQYENIDGSEVDYNALFGPDHLFTDALELFQGKDPRLFATVLMQGSLFSSDNYVMQFYDGIDIGATPDPENIIANPTGMYEGYAQVGLDSRMTIGDDRNTNSGFLVRKYLQEPDLPIPEQTSSTEWIRLRLAEVYLTKAEASFELEAIDDAVNALNAVRERAGISPVDEITISMGKIQNEWLVEFAFEGKRYWDLRRWRQSESVLNTTINGLSTIWHFASNKYYFLPINAEGFNRVFLPRHYYNPISTSRINNNVLLKQNPSY